MVIVTKLLDFIHTYPGINAARSIPISFVEPLPPHTFGPSSSLLARVIPCVLLRAAALVTVKAVTVWCVQPEGPVDGSRVVWRRRGRDQASVARNSSGTRPGEAAPETDSVGTLPLRPSGKRDVAETQRQAEVFAERVALCSGRCVAGGLECVLCPAVCFPERGPAELLHVVVLRCRALRLQPRAPSDVPCP